jgi:dihydropteroate synthase
MAIVNRTPDSFHDRGRTYALEQAVAAVRAAAGAGADWIDIGGVPFAPGPEVSAAEELDRVLPVVEAARDLAVVSVDTFRPDGPREVIAAGAGVINDTVRPARPGDGGRGGRHARRTGRSRTAWPLRAPSTPRPAYADVTAEVARFLRERVAVRAGARGYARSRSSSTRATT